jgi:hypothetical protein
MRMTNNCNHCWVTHSHASGLFCISCGIEKPEYPYQLTGHYKSDVEGLIKTIEMLKDKLKEQK